MFQRGLDGIDILRNPFEKRVHQIEASREVLEQDWVECVSTLYHVRSPVFRVSLLRLHVLCVILEGIGVNF